MTAGVAQMSTGRVIKAVPPAVAIMFLFLDYRDSCALHFDLAADNPDGAGRSLSNSVGNSCRPAGRHSLFLQGCTGRSL